MRRKKGEAVCSGCGAENRLKGQRYGRQCKNEANRKYRSRLSELIARARKKERNANLR